MPAHRTRIATAGAGLAAVATLLLTSAPATAASPDYAVTTDPVRAAGGWLATQFVDHTHLPAPDGDHFDSKYGKTYFPNYGENADVVFGLVAAQSSSDKVEVALGYLADHLAEYADPRGANGGPYDGSIAKAAVAEIVAGDEATNVGGYNLLQLLKQDECPASSTSCTPGEAANIFSSISESFVVLAEARAGGSYAPSAAALDYLTSLQCPSGGFTDKTDACTAGTPDLDATSYAIMALSAAGADQSVIDKAIAWLREQQHPAGYWVSQGTANVNSTGLATAALAGAGVDVSSARTWLRQQQIPAGHPGAGALRYAGTFTPTTTSATSPSVLATAQGLCGLVPNGSLATLSATAMDRGPALYAPRGRLSADSVQAGHAITATGTGFAAGERVRISIASRPVVLATVTADASGVAAARVHVPATMAPGRHDVTLDGLSSGLGAAAALRVTAAPSPSTSPTAAPTTSAPPAPVHASHSAAAIPVANTGQNQQHLVLLSGLAVAAIAAGGLLIRVGRRRAH